MTFKELKKIYKSINPKCNGRLGKVFVLGSGLYDIPCQKWNCKKCRPHKKFEIYLDILRYVYIYHLQRHFVITFAGKKVRDLCSWEESYKFMAKQWIKFRKCIEYKYGKLTYILLARAQESGYCHYHILTNKYLDWYFLNKKRKNYGLGYVSIQKNKDVAEYLNTDFFKEHEWFIPLNIRHFRCSRDIKLTYNAKDSNKLVFNNKVSKDEIKKQIYYSFQEVYDMNDYYEYKMINNNLGFLKLKEIDKKEIIMEVKKNGRK